MTDAEEALKTFFTKYAVRKDLVEKITKASTDGGLGCESVADFRGYFTQQDYEQGVQDLILDGASHAKDRIALSRLYEWHGPSPLRPWLQSRYLLLLGLLWTLRPRVKMENVSTKRHSKCI